MANINLDEYSFSDESSSLADSANEFVPSPRRDPPGVEYEIGSISPSRENPNPIEDMASSTDEEVNA